MIRLIQRRLIIPQGDTGAFTIPTQGMVSEGDIAILSIFDSLTRTVVLEKKIAATPNTLTFNFVSEDTASIEPDGNYTWDITLIRNPEVDEDNNLIHADSIDSYYAAFKLPVCEIRRVTREIH